MRKKFLRLDEYQFLDLLHLIILYVRAHNFTIVDEKPIKHFRKNWARDWRV